MTVGEVVDGEGDGRGGGVAEVASVGHVCGAVMTTVINGCWSVFHYEKRLRWILFFMYELEFYAEVRYYVLRSH